MSARFNSTVNQTGNLTTLHPRYQTSHRPIFIGILRSGYYRWLHHAATLAGPAILGLVSTTRKKPDQIITFAQVPYSTVLPL